MKKLTLLIFLAALILLSSYALADNYWINPPKANDGILAYVNFDLGLNNTDNLGIYNFTNNSGQSTTGKTNEGWYFNGTQNKGIITKNLFNNMTKYDNFTIEFWFNPNQTITSGVAQKWIMQKDNNVGGGDNYFGFYYLNNQIFFDYIHQGEGTSLNTTARDYPAGTFVHLAVVVSNSSRTAKIYLNGILNNSLTMTQGNMVNDFSGTNFTIGTTQANAAPANFTIDEFKIWNITRTQAEIQTDMIGTSEIIENFQTFNANALAGSSETFTIGIDYNSTKYSSISGSLFYNGTNYGGTQQGTGDIINFTKTINVPAVTAVINLNLYWQFVLFNGTDNIYINSSTKTQTLTNIAIDNCSVQTVLILNYTMKDEDGESKLTSTNNMSMELDLNLSTTSGLLSVSHFSKLYNNTNPMLVCISQSLGSSVLRIDAISKFSSSGHIIEYYHIQNSTLTASSIPQNITLYDLLTTSSQEFLVTFKDENFAVVQDALIDVTRYYVSQGVYKTVEVSKTDAHGQTLVHLVLGDVIYTINVYKNGKLLATFPNVQATCADITINNCQLNLNAAQTPFSVSDYAARGNIVYTFTFDKTLRRLTSTFSTLDGSVSTVNLSVINANVYMNDTLCSNQLTSSSGTLFCDVPTSLGNITIRGRLTNNGNQIADFYYTIKEDAGSVFGGFRIIMMLMIMLTLPMMAIGSPIAMIIAVIAGLILATILNLYEGQNIIGVGSTIIWMIGLAGIMIWKITRGRNG